MTNTLQRFVNPPAPRRAYHVRASVTFYRHYTLLKSLVSYGSSHADPKGLEIFLDTSVSDHDLGEASWLALRAARFVPPEHSDFHILEEGWTLDEDRAYHARLMKQAGVKTRKALYAGAVSVTMNREDGIITLRTSIPHGGNGFRGYKGMPQENLPDTITNEALGRALRDITTQTLAQGWG
jgi:CDI immunity protein